MRLFIFAILIFSLVTSGVFLSSHLATNAIEDIQRGLAQIPSPTPEDTDLTLQYELLVKVIDDWNKISVAIGTVVSHQDIMVLEEELSALLQNAEHSNANLYLESLARVDYILNHMREMAAVLFRNIL